MNFVTATITTPRITILLSTYNGGRFLPAQLESFERQSHTAWDILWRDDGSSDETRQIMDQFTAKIGAGRCVEADNSGPHLGAAPSFLTLLARAQACEALAFSDQDDVWLPDKLARAAAKLRDIDDQPLLYCARQYLVDEALQGMKLSMMLSNPPGFPASLTQNIAHGNTMVMNRQAAALVAKMPGPAGTIHDWWSYIVVAACGGKIIIDPKPVVLYRQHPDNLIGSPRSTLGRAIAALQRGPGIFMTMMRRHVSQLQTYQAALSPQAQSDLSLISNALQGSYLDRVKALRSPHFRRQTALENLLFRFWFLMG